MSIGSILPDVLAECGIDRVAPTINDTSFEMRQIKSLMNTAGLDIATRAEWQALAAELTVANVSNVLLPADFQEMAEGGAVVINGPEFVASRSVVSPQMWQMLESVPSAQPHYHIRGGRIFFSPAIGPDGAVIRYQSKNWLVGKDAITSNDDVPVFPEKLLVRGTIWRWRRQKGLPFDDIVAEAEAELETAIKADRGVA